MKTLLQFLCMALIAFSVQATNVSFKGTKPAVIIDVRTPEEFASGHIDGAINIPYDKIGQGIQSIKGLSKESPILVYCRCGRRSAIARGTLEQQGFKRIIDGGDIVSVTLSLHARNLLNSPTGFNFHSH